MLMTKKYNLLVMTGISQILPEINDFTLAGPTAGQLTLQGPVTL